jgi:hypothetical protein
VQEVLHLAGRDYLANPKGLAMLIAPVVAKSESEQSRFYELFDAYYRELNQTATPLEKAMESKAAKPVSQVRRYYWLAAIPLLLGLLLWYLWREQPNASLLKAASFRSIVLHEADYLHAFIIHNPAEAQSISFGDGSPMLAISNDSVSHQFERAGTYVVQLLGKGNVIFSDTIQVQSLCAQWQLSAPVQDSSGHISLRAESPCRASRADFRYEWDIRKSTADTTLLIRLPKHSDSVSFVRGNSPGNFSVRLQIFASDTLLAEAHSYFASYSDGVSDLFPLSVRQAGRPLEASYPLTTAAKVLPVLMLFAFLMLSGYAARRWQEKEAQKKPDVPETVSLKDLPPYHLSFPDNVARVRTGKQFGEVADALRVREYSERHRPDLPATIYKTVRSGGFPELVFKADTRQSAWLILAEKTEKNDHCHAFAQTITKLLVGSDVQAECFSFTGYSNHCWNKQMPQGMSFAQLAMRYQGWKLLVFGNGHCWLDGFEASLRPEIADWLAQWSYKALLSPQILTGQGWEEEIISRYLPLFGADLNGLLEAQRALSSGDDGWWQHHAPSEANETTASSEPLDQLLALPEVCVDWLSMTVVFPEKNWELLIAMGDALAEHDEAFRKEINLQNLSLISQLSWMREGTMPQHVRQMLQERLYRKPWLESLAHSTLQTQLSQMALPEGSLAAFERDALLGISQLAMDPYREQLRKELQRLQQGGLLPRHWAGLMPPEPEKAIEPSLNKVQAETSMLSETESPAQKESWSLWKMLTIYVIPVMVTLAFMAGLYWVFAKTLALVFPKASWRVSTVLPVLHLQGNAEAWSGEPDTIPLVVHLPDTDLPLHFYPNRADTSLTLPTAATAIWLTLGNKAPFFQSDTIRLATDSLLVDLNAYIDRWRSFNQSSGKTDNFGSIGVEETKPEPEPDNRAQEEEALVQKAFAAISATMPPFFSSKHNARATLANQTAKSQTWELSDLRSVILPNYTTREELVFSFRVSSQNRRQVLIDMQIRGRVRLENAEQGGISYRELETAYPDELNVFGEVMERALNPSLRNARIRYQKVRGREIELKMPTNTPH